MEPMKLEPAKFNLGGGGFNPSAGAFVPKNTFNAHTMDNEPSLADAFGDDTPKKGGKKGGKKGKKKMAVVEQKKDEDELTEEQKAQPWKGKPSSFFIMQQDESKADEQNPMGFEMNDDQWDFIFKHYPEYGASPYEMMTWIYGEAM